MYTNGFVNRYGLWNESAKFSTEKLQPISSSGSGFVLTSLHRVRQYAALFLLNDGGSVPSPKTNRGSGRGLGGRGGHLGVIHSREFSLGQRACERRTGYCAERSCRAIGGFLS